jgi:signal transduction histidine kinase/ActR/RegA family two-component response regulator
MTYLSERVSSLESAIVRNFPVVKPDLPIVEVLKQLNTTEHPQPSGAEIRSSCILVTKNDELVGLIIDRDIVQAIAHGVDLADVTVGELMTHLPIAIDREKFTDVATALDIINEHQIDYLPLVDRQNRPVGLLTRPLLLQANHDREIDRLNSELTARAQEIESLEWKNVDLGADVEELAHTAKFKDEFIANMSHELRTPLNAILGMTGGLQDGVFGTATPAQIQAVQTIAKSGNHLLSLVNDILDLAKVGSGHMELECAPTDIAQLCKSSLSFVKLQALKKRIGLHIKLPSRLPELKIDERRMRQVAINLLANAVKYTPEEGNVTLQAKIITDSGSKNWLRIMTIDTGIGIDRADIKKLFQPFMQVDTALNRQYTGTGLGLALVKRIVELHGGKVDVQSEVGIGSQFIVDLPIPADTIDLGSDPIAENSGFIPLTLSGGHGSISSRRNCHRVLLMDNSEASITSIGNYLRAKGYETIFAKHSLEAIELARSQLPDLILIGVRVPKFDELAAIEYLRGDRQTQNLPIIALVDFTTPDERDRCLRAGANECLSKPIKLKQLSDTIRSFSTKK